MKGIETCKYQVEGYGDTSIADAFYVKIDNTILEFKENPDDGYRSYCDAEIVTSVPQNVFFNLESHPIRCYLKNYDGADNDNEFRGIKFFTDEDCSKMLAEFGTNHSDDYYPSCICYMDIPAINEHIANNHLLS